MPCVFWKSDLMKDRISCREFTQYNLLPSSTKSRDRADALHFEHHADALSHPTFLELKDMPCGTVLSSQMLGRGCSVVPVE